MKAGDIPLTQEAVLRCSCCGIEGNHNVVTKCGCLERNGEARYDIVKAGWLLPPGYAREATA